MTLLFFALFFALVGCACGVLGVPLHVERWTTPRHVVERNATKVADMHARLLGAMNARANATANDALRLFVAAFVETQSLEYGAPSMGMVAVDAGRQWSYAQASVGNEGVLDAHVQATQNKEFLFRIASVSKSVTATCLMMCVERGLLALDDPIDKYLPDELLFGKDDQALGVITVRHLLTHRGGFEESIIGQVALSTDLLLPLQEFLIKVRPTRVFPAGKVPSYSNYGFSLLGLMVERVSGISYESFVRTHLFAPLEMDLSVISPRDPILNGDTTSYWDRVVPQTMARDTPNPLGDYVFQFVPAGQIMLTVDDMIRYARFHLSDGQAPNGTQLLSRELVQDMHAGHYTKPLGVGYGFAEYYLGSTGELVVGHDGDMPTMSSRFMMVPSQKIALFMSVGIGGLPVRDNMARSYANEFAKNIDDISSRPKVAANPAAAKTRAVDATYLNTRTTFTGCMSLAAHISGGASSVLPRGDGLVDLNFMGLVTIPYEPLDKEASLFMEPVTTAENLQFRFPFLVLSDDEVDGKPEFIIFIDALNGGALRTNVSWSPWITGLFISGGFILMLLSTCCFCLSCCLRQFFPDMAKSRPAMSTRNLRVTSVGTPMLDAEDAALFDNPRKPFLSMPSERRAHDLLVYGWVPFATISLCVMVFVYLQYVGRMAVSFSPTIGLFLIIPYLILICAFSSCACAVESIVKSWWWPERRIIFSCWSLCFVMFAFGIMLTNGLQTSCWH